MANPTLEELDVALLRHNSLDPNQRILDDPPVVTIAVRRCRECGNEGEPLVLGWDIIAELVKARDVELPEEIDVLCEGCRQEAEEA